MEKASHTSDHRARRPQCYFFLHNVHITIHRLIKAMVSYTPKDHKKRGQVAEQGGPGAFNDAELTLRLT